MNKKRKYLLGIAIPLIMFLISFGIASEVSYSGPFKADAIPVWVICVAAIALFTYFFTFKDTDKYE